MVRYISFLKLSENHEKLAEKVDFYSSISLAGSGFRIRIRIQPGDLNRIHPDPDPQHCLPVPVLGSFCDEVFLLGLNTNGTGTYLPAP